MPHKLLLADDSLTIQKVVELVLAPENFEIKTVSDGEQAIAVLESFIPDIILADIEMPKTNGYQLCEKIKNNPTTSNVPVILLAGAFEPFDEEYARTVGADDFIIKPFESQELISKVKALIASFEPSHEAVEEEIYGDDSAVVAAKPQAETQSEEAVVSLSVQEPAWEQEIPPLEQKNYEPDMAEEEYEAKAASIESHSEKLEETRAFAEEFAEALKMEEKSMKIASMDETIEMPSIELPVEEKSQKLNIMPEIVEPIAHKPAPQEAALYAAETMKDSIKETISEIAPKIIEDVTRELVGNLLGSLRSEIDAAIRKIVPEVAENIIKKEIEKISSEIS